MKPLIQLFFLLFTLLVFPGKAPAVQEIDWSDLVPELPPEENPLAGLSEEEVGFIEWIIYLRESLPKEVTSENQEFHDEMNEAMPELRDKGIDVDEIIAQRQYRNSAVNEQLNEKKVRLAGYLLPLDFSGNAISDFLLVPYVGACIHVPPPPQNQIVHAVTTTPTAFEIEELFKPVNVTGTIKVQALSKELFLVDGSSDIMIGYSMRVDKVEDYHY